MLSRRTLIAAGVAAPAILSRPVWAAEFTLKYGNNMPPTHPITLRAQEAAEAIKQETGGRVELLVFPNNQLGDDINMFSQVRSGALQFQTIGGVVLETRVPDLSIHNTAFAFQGYDQVWAAMDGKLGDLLRGKIRNAGFNVLKNVWDNGFRHITTGSRQINSPDDLKGVKMRVPPGKIYTRLFESLGASPTTMVLSEVYTALQTKVIDGQENALVLVDSAKFYEVQKYCALTGHVWDCYFMIGNKAAWDKLPAALQTIVSTQLENAALKERADIMALEKRMQSEIAAKGMTFNTPNKEAFKAVLNKSTFYTELRKSYGPETWQLLENTTGPLG